MPFATTTLGAVAQSVVGTLQKPDETKNKYIFVASFVTTQQKIIEQIEKIKGIEFETSSVSSKDLIGENLAKLKKGDYSGATTLIQTSFLNYEGLGDYTARETLSNELLGLPKEDLGEETRKAL